MVLYLLNGSDIEHTIHQLELQQNLCSGVELETITIQLEIYERIKNAAVKVNFAPVTVDGLLDEIVNLKSKTNGKANGTSKQH